MGIDTMIILVLIPFLLVLLAQIILKITYRKYESIETDTGLTGKEVANKILKENNVVVDKELERKVNELIVKRNSLKKEKKYEEADKVRNEIKALGAEIKDTREGVVIIWE